jgi:hypothetical protein
MNHAAKGSVFVDLRNAGNLKNWPTHFGFLLRSIEDKASRERNDAQNSYFTEMRSGSEAGSYLRLIDFGITQL